MIFDINKTRQRKLVRGILNALKTPIGVFSSDYQGSESDLVWQFSKHSYSCYSFESEIRRSLDGLVVEVAKFDNIRIPITQFYGSCSGKSEQRASLRHFAFEVLHEPRDSRDIAFETDEDWAVNIRSFERRFHGVWPYARFFAWSQRLYLVNGDQSHHFAAIFRQAETQARNWEVPCNLTVFDWAEIDMPVEGMPIIFLSRDKLDVSYQSCASAGVRLEYEVVGQEDLGIYAYRVVGLSVETWRMLYSGVLACEEKGVACHLAHMRLRFMKTRYGP